MSGSAPTSSQSSPKPRLSGKVCVVTGAGSSKGIGWATVTKFAQEGATHVYILDIAVDELPGLTFALSAKHPNTKITFVKGDVTDEPTVSSFCDRVIAECGKLDVFFANAGGTHGTFGSLFKDISPEVFLKTVRLNTLACFIAAKHAVRCMEKTSSKHGKEAGGGSLIFTSSIAGMASMPGGVDYSASKAAIINMTQNIAYECQMLHNGVRVNAVCPGVIDTAMSAPALVQLRSMGTYADAVIGIGAPQDIANMVSFLASDESSYITAQHFTVDGGLTNPVAMNKLKVV